MNCPVAILGNTGIYTLNFPPIFPPSPNPLTVQILSELSGQFLKSTDTNHFAEAVSFDSSLELGFRNSMLAYFPLLYMYYFSHMTTAYPRHSWESNYCGYLYVMGIPSRVFWIHPLHQWILWWKCELNKVEISSLGRIPKDPIKCFTLISLSISHRELIMLFHLFIIFPNIFWIF